MTVQPSSHFSTAYFLANVNGVKETVNLGFRWHWSVYYMAAKAA